MTASTTGNKATRHYVAAAGTGADRGPRGERVGGGGRNGNMQDTRHGRWAAEAGERSILFSVVSCDLSRHRTFMSWLLEIFGVGGC